VHGPLLATLLVELLHEHRPHERLARFEFRAMRPTFDTQPFFTGGAPRENAREIDLWARDPDGALAMKALATLR
jgi:3-methylfumaryl-CoA hydratase